MPPFGLWRKGLFTHEDPVNVHKLFGFPCLLHFLYRTISVIPNPLGDMGFGKGTAATLALICMHLCLSCTSLVFKLPKVRIKEGSRIWPEFRLHSIVFACRSLACMAIVWLEHRYQPARPWYWANVLVVFATLIAADASTASLDPISRSNTIRGLDALPTTKMAFSLMQFLGTCGCLVGLRAYAGQFAIVFVIQTYAFTLTLRRKNLVTHRQTVIIYAYQLTLGVAAANIEIWQAGGWEAMCMFPALACFAYLLRTRLGLNKYALWALMAALIQCARRATPIVPADERLAWWPWWGWPAAAALNLGVVGAGLWQKTVEYHAAKATEAAAGGAKKGE